jgi:predicted ferric reductase
MNRIRAAWIFAYAANALAILAFWWRATLSTSTHGVSGDLIATGDVFGLIGAYSLLWQLILMSRLIPLERAFGMSELTRLHRLNGYAATSLLVCHPLILAVGYGIASHIAFLPQLWLFVTSFQDVLDATIALGLILLLVALTVTIVKRRLPYEGWYYVHLSAYLAILLAFSHQTSVGSSFVANPAFAHYWDVLYIATALLVLYFRFFVQAARFARHRFVVDRIVREAPGVVSIYVTGRNLGTFHFAPGQFASWRFLAPELFWQTHPFSFSQAHNGECLRLTAKAAGDFTKRLGILKVGTPVIVDGPHGVFTPALLQSGKALLVAGGIGITPLRSLIEALPDSVDVVLLYAARTPDDLVFRTELDDLFKRRPHFRVAYLTSRTGTAGSLKGRINLKTVRELVPDAAEREAYLCGPVSMVASVEQLLRQLGIPKDNIYSERFSY